MLTLKDAWTNEWSGRDSILFWFAALDEGGQWWWLSAVANRKLGFMSAQLHKVEGRERILPEMDDDEPEEQLDWLRVNPDEALGRIRAEFERMHLAEWAQVYTNYYRQVCDEYARLMETIDGSREPEEYQTVWQRSS